MNIIFLDFDGVITTYESRWCIDIGKVELIEEIVSKTDSKIVVTSSWKVGSLDVEHFKQKLTVEKAFKTGNVLNYPQFKKFLEHIYDITDCKGSWRGDEIQRWLDSHEEEIDNYVILDDDSDFTEEQLFNFVQTDTYEGITPREVKLCVARLTNTPIRNPIRMNLVLTTMWRNNNQGLKNDIETLLNKYIHEQQLKYKELNCW